MTDHLWPARPEYLRRGTPVWEGGCPWLVDSVDADGACCLVADEETDHATTHTIRIDLRDVTARAYAAMAYTLTGYMGWSPGLRVISTLTVAHLEVPLGRERRQVWEHVQVLRRMRALDESVTVAEARAALLWAESVVDALGVERG